MPLPLIQARKLSKTFLQSRERRCILDDVDLEIRAGERIALVGPNGSGKTTFLRILLGIERQDAGEVVWNDSKAQHSVAYVPQDYRHALFPWFTLRTNLAMAIPAYHQRSLFSRSNREWLKTLEEKYRQLESEYSVLLNLDKYPYQLSGGEQQIFLLIRSLLGNAQVLVLDEPLSAVDYGRKNKIRDSLGRRFAQADITLLFSSHDFEEAVQLADRVIVFTRDSGRVKAIVPVNLSWPRANAVRREREFNAIVETITKAVL